MSILILLRQLTDMRITHIRRYIGIDFTFEGSYTNWNDMVKSTALGIEIPTTLVGTKQFAIEIGQDWWSIYGGGFISKFSTASYRMKNAEILTSEDFKLIFLGKKGSFTNGTTIVPVALPETSHGQVEFLKKGYT